MNFPNFRSGLGQPCYLVLLEYILLTPKGRIQPVYLRAEPTPYTCKNRQTTHVIVQAQGGEVSYRFDGCDETVAGFLLRDRDIVTLEIGQNPLVFWATGRDVRVVIQEMV